MIDVQEHFYHDDPQQGHPDVRTRLKDVSYFFLGNGLIKAAIQLAPSGEGTPFGLLIMPPDRLGMKRDALTMDPRSGLEDTMIYLNVNHSMETVNPANLKACWFNENHAPAIKVEWQSHSFHIIELLYCPDLIHPQLVRKLQIKNITGQKRQALLKTGIVTETIARPLSFTENEEITISLIYHLEESGEKLHLEVLPHFLGSEQSRRYWEKTAHVSFNLPILDHYFNASKIQLATVISRNSVVDASIWQYNGEWVRDHSMMAIGLTLAGHQEMARKMIIRLFNDFVTKEGDTVDSSKVRHYDEVELDQNGILLYALKNYVVWTGDSDIIDELWQKIEITAEFPLKAVFRHVPSGLVANQREFWERHRVYGIPPGMELAYQFWVSMGLAAAATLARVAARNSIATRWDNEAARIKTTILNDPKFRFVDDRGFIKRRRMDGRVSETITALPEAQLPKGVPLSTPVTHWLNPDTSAALPVAYEFIPPVSPVARATMKNLEKLWNQSWEGGGYGRYHYSSEPDSPGAWPFPSLFIARAYLEMGEFEKVWRILNWLNDIGGAESGSWFEFYGPRLAPPFPQVGIPPWTWAEMLLLLIHHIIGLRPEVDHFKLRPKLLPGIDVIEASIPIRDVRLHLKLQHDANLKTGLFRSNNLIINSSEQEVDISYSKDDIWVEAIVP